MEIPPCRQCGRCCKTENEYAVILFPQDVESLAAFFGMPAGAFLFAHCVSRQVSGHTVYYLRKETPGQCRFLQGNRCAVYPSRPAQCRLAPYRFFADYPNWRHVPCIGSEARYNACKTDSAASDRALLATIVERGYV